MTLNKKFTGSTVALITPMKNDGAVDFDSLKNIINFHIENKTSAIVSVGTTGESATLSHHENLEVIKKTIEYASGEIPIIAGTGSNSTEEAIYLTKKAKELGADAALLVTPYYNKPTQEGLYQHYKKIAKAVDIDIILYNVPSRTAVDLLPDTVLRLSKINNIIGIKDATGNLNVTKSLIKICPDDFLLLSGDDASAVDFTLLGGHGGISVSANVAPFEVQQAYQLAISGDNKKAKDLDNKLQELHKNLFIESSPIPVKWALYKMGKCNKGIRLPLTILSDEYHNIIQNTLMNLGVISNV